MNRTRTAAAYLILALAMPAALMSAAYAQLGAAKLDWRQRYLGILPLVKPNPKDPVVVRVNGTLITVAEVDSYARTEGRMVNATTTSETRAVWRDAMDNLIGRQLLYDEAKRRGIEVSDAEVAARAREFQIASPGGQPVSATGAPDAQLMSEVRASMMIERMLDQVFAKRSVKPTDAEIRRYYDEHKDLFVIDPGEARISHIAVKLPPNADEQQKKAAEEKIHALYRQALKTRDFAKLAREKSEDERSAPNGGDLGYFRPGQLPPVIDKLVFSTPIGHLTPIITSSIGYSFIKVTQRRNAKYAPLKDVREKIALVILDYNQDAVIKEVLNSLKRKARIEFAKQPRPA
jgi:peptidyl-prolyl cis-trans isomerase C